MTTKTNTKANRPSFECGAFIFYKPKGIALITSVVLIGLCLGLGVWQLERLAWKNALIAKLEASYETSGFNRKTLPQNLNDLREHEFEKVNLPGEFLHKHEFHLMGRYHQGQVGYNILTPFSVDGEEERILLVNRGWVPVDKKNVEDRAEDARFDGLVFLTGWVMSPSGRNSFLPNHDLEENIWFWYDTETMREQAGLNFPDVVIQYVNATPPPNSLPIPLENYHFELRNDHLNYAFIWFSLAFSGLVIFFIYHLKAVKGEEDEEDKKEGEDA